MTKPFRLNVPQAALEQPEALAKEVKAFFSGLA